MILDTRPRRRNPDTYEHDPTIRKWLDDRPRASRAKIILAGCGMAGAILGLFEAGYILGWW